MCSRSLTMVTICAKLNVPLKSPDECGSSAQNKHFSITCKCDLNLCSRDLVLARLTASHCGEHFYAVSYESNHTWRIYALDNISIFDNFK